MPKQDLKSRAHQSMRIIWGALVGLATLGGVLGLYQFLTDQDAAPDDSRAIIARMIENGQIDVDKADDLRALIDDTDAADAVLASAFEEGSTRQLEALTLLALPSTQAQGLAILESEAETADEYIRLSRLAFSRDTDMAVEAARKAVSLDPGNVAYLEMLARAQLENEDFAQARRTSATLETISRTPKEKLFSENLKAVLAIERLDQSQLEKRYEALNAALQRYTDMPDFALPDETLSVSRVEEQPYWLAAYAGEHLTYLSIRSSNWLRALDDAVRTIDYFEALEPYVSGRTLQNLQRREAAMHDARANAMHRLDRIANHHEAHEKSIELYRSLAEAGDLTALQSLPNRLQRVGLEYAWLGEMETALARTDEAVQRQTALIERFPDEWQHEYMLFLMKAQQLRLSDRSEDANALIKQLIAQTEADMLESGFDVARVNQLAGAVMTEIREAELMKRERSAVLPFHQDMLDMITAMERRFGASPDIQRSRLSAKLALAYDHNQLGNTDIAADIHREIVSQSDALPDDDETRVSYKLYSLQRLAYLADDGEVYAQHGLDLATELDGRDALSTTNQAYLSQFARILREKEGTED